MLDQPGLLPRLAALAVGATRGGAAGGFVAAVPDRGELIAELAALSVEIAAAAAWLAHPDAQDSARHIAAELERLSDTAALDEDPQRAADDLGGAAFRLVRLAATNGGYEGLRPVLALAHRLQLIRDAIDPETMRRCLYCSTIIRVSNDDRLERHVDQAGHLCDGSAT